MHRSEPLALWTSHKYTQNHHIGHPRLPQIMTMAHVHDLYVCFKSELFSWYMSVQWYIFFSLRLHRQWIIMESAEVFKAHSHCTFFQILIAIPLITTNGLYRTQWKCSHYATATTPPAFTQPIVSKSKLQLQIAQCERALRPCVFCMQLRLHRWVHCTYILCNWNEKKNAVAIRKKPTV